MENQQLDFAFQRYAGGVTKLAVLGLLQQHSRCVHETAVTSTLDIKESKALRKLVVGEVVEGPRKENASEIQRVKGRTSRDKTGWVTLKDAQDNAFLEPTKVLVCKQGVALTPEFDISKGKPLRKLDAGEALEVLGEPQEVEQKNMSRQHVRSQKDRAEGWVTVRGNQGTSFMEESDRHYVCKMGVPLEQRFECGSALVRSLEAG